MRLPTKALAAALALAAAAPLAAQDKVLTIAGSGGVVKEIGEKIFIPVFKEETGWDTNFIVAEGKTMLEVESMLKAGKMLYDVMEVSASDYPVGVKKGLLAKIDYAKLDPDNILNPGKVLPV